MRHAWIIGPIAALTVAVFAGAAAVREKPGPRVLITAFEPFGKRAATGRNASLDVLRELRAKHGSRFAYAVLPVSDASEEKLKSLLASGRYTGVVALGEDIRLPGHTVHLEPYAADAPLSTHLRPTRPLERVPSPAARHAAKTTGLPLVSGIGFYYCNRVYLHALHWGHRNDRPAVFIHVPVQGDRATHVRQVLAVAAACE